jgi:hypothetical protein
MNTTVSVHNIAHLSDLQCKGCIFKWLLHLSRAKVSEISSLLSRGAVRMLARELCELLSKGRRVAERLIEVILMSSKNAGGVLFGTNDRFLE